MEATTTDHITNHGQAVGKRGVALILGLAGRVLWSSEAAFAGRYVNTIDDDLDCATPAVD